MFSSNFIHFMSVLLLLCGIVVAERGQLSSQRRRTSIGDRPPALVTPSASASSDDNSGKGADIGKGKGGALYDDDEIGKGMKSEKSYKSFESKHSKSHKSYHNGKGIILGKGISLSMSMEMELPDGKGGKMEKSFKSEKKDKLSKKSKKDYGKITPKPVMQPSASPPGPYVPQTSSPTALDSISAKSSPYAITYSPSTDTPNTDDYAELTSATQGYLEDAMKEFFEKTALTDLDNFLTIMVREAFIEGEPVLVTYESNGLFNPDSIFIPVTREIDNLIQDVIGSEDYLALVKSLPASNPFRSTEQIILSLVDEASTEVEASAAETSSSSDGKSKSEGSSSKARAGVAAAAAGIVVLAASLTMLRSRRVGHGDEDQSLSPQKLCSEDSTIAGETCNMSMDDSSSHSTNWRTMKTFNETNEHEFEDEPLDSDNECEKMTATVSLS
mmetsp:Transcript_31811/g.36529  ORF Transcript_31811/g.36529 Transcript_31811/m.36529 type:complete len:443 (+) Transcript_31811:252-1580(+)